MKIGETKFSVYWGLISGKILTILILYFNRYSFQRVSRIVLKLKRRTWILGVLDSLQKLSIPDVLLDAHEGPPPAVVVCYQDPVVKSFPSSFYLKFELL